MASKKFELTAESIRKFRDSRGISRTRLGTLLGGISMQTIKNWEKGNSTPPPYLRLALLYLVEKGIVTSMTQHEKDKESDNPFA